MRTHLKAFTDHNKPAVEKDHTNSSVADAVVARLREERSAPTASDCADNENWLELS